MPSEPTRCGCPGHNVISSQGMCPSCGVEGPNHQRVLHEHLAAGNPQPLLDRARSEGRLEGWQLGHERGIEVGRAQLEDELSPLYEPERRPFDGPDLELAG